MIELFVKLIIGTVFHHGDTPERLLIKADETHYLAPDGRHKIHPHVAVFTKKPKYVDRSIYDQSVKGDSDGRDPDPRDH